MALVYPLTMPSDPAPKRVSFSIVTAIGVTQSPFTLAQQLQEWSGQSWVADVTLPVMDRAEAEPWIAFLLALNGKQGTFLLGDPKGGTPRGTATGTPLLNGAHAAGASSLVTDGWTASVTGILKLGDYLQIGTRMHKVVGADVTSDGSGNATIEIWPRLRESATDNTPLLTGSVKGVFRLRDNSLPLFDLSETGIYELSFGAIEAF